jgi:uncharacterized protein YbjT (DUF2867 family)
VGCASACATPRSDAADDALAANRRTGHPERVNVIIFGATGMIGQAALLACIEDRSIERIILVLRTGVPQRDERITQIVHDDFYDFTPLRDQFAGLDACLFCLGVTSVGKKEPEYRRITYDITIAAARVLAEVNPGMVFEYVSGTGTDSTERGRVMWARVKGATENALLKMDLRAYGIRPTFILPMRGIATKTWLYRGVYRVSGLLYPVLKRISPASVITSEEIGRAMIAIAVRRPEERIFDSAAMKALIATS